MLKVKIPPLAILITLCISVCLATIGNCGDATAQLHPIRVGYSSISGGRIMLWTAHDRGFFARQGLPSEWSGTTGTMRPTVEAGSGAGRSRGLCAAAGFPGVSGRVSEWMER